MGTRRSHSDTPGNRIGNPVNLIASLTHPHSGWGAACR